MIVGNARNVRVSNVFASGLFDRHIEAAFEADGTPPVNEGRCGVEADNIEFVGIVSVAPEFWCGRFEATGFNTHVSVSNMVCYNPPSAGFFFQSLGSEFTGGGTWYTTTGHVLLTFRNTVIHTAPDNFASENLSRITHDHNGWFNVTGGVPSGSGGGDLTSNPSLAGPLTVPQASAVASPIWDWPGVIQPIIEQFRTEAEAYTDAGIGEPFTGTAPDIGANEWFQPQEAAVWVSCATTEYGQPVFSSSLNTPWISGRSGLVVDVDCAQKRIVIGRCDDPLDEETCDDDIYIHKSARLRVRRSDAGISLSSGTVTADEDTSGVCWRTRAVYDFTESLEQVFGVWIRYEVDPDGSTHDCATTATPRWAWQGFD